MRHSVTTTESGDAIGPDPGRSWIQTFVVAVEVVLILSLVREVEAESQMFGSDQVGDVHRVVEKFAEVGVGRTS